MLRGFNSQVQRVGSEEYLIGRFVAKTWVKSPQTNGICERFHKTILQEFYKTTFRK